MMFNSLRISSFAFLLALQSPRQRPAPEATSEPQLQRRVLTIGERQRTYWLHVPRSYASQTHRSLVIALHGAGGNGRYQARSYGLTELADSAGFIVAFPDGSGRLERMLTWNAGRCCGFAFTRGIDDVAFIRQVIDDVVASQHVDSTRVYVAGMSNGGMMAYRLAAELPDRVAAIASVAGALITDPSSITHGIPILHVHGTDDPIVPYEGGPNAYAPDPFPSVQQTIDAWVRANNAGSVPTETTMPDCTNDGTRVVRYSYATPTDSQAVVLYKVIGGGHAWPGQTAPRQRGGRSSTDISATSLIWEFFAAHPRRPN